jgi:hypothetical protein
MMSQIVFEVQRSIERPEPGPPFRTTVHPGFLEQPVPNRAIHGPHRCSIVSELLELNPMTYFKDGSATILLN